MRFSSISSFFCLSSLLVTEGAVIVTLGNVARVVSAGSTLQELVVSWNGNGWNIDSKNVLSKYVRNVGLCFEEFTAYYGNNHRFGDENPQKTRLAFQRSCEAHPSCHFWTFRKPLEGQDTGLCYLKTKRENVTPNVTDYVSGSKGCKLPEWTGIQSAAL